MRTTRQDIEDWGRENGANGACAVCGQKTWIEFGCAPLCMGCDADAEPPQERDTLANLGLSEADFR